MELNSGALKEQQMLLTSALSLQPCLSGDLTPARPPIYTPTGDRNELERGFGGLCPGEGLLLLHLHPVLKLDLFPQIFNCFSTLAAGWLFLGVE